jgi:hypothetical protein
MLFQEYILENTERLNACLYDRFMDLYGTERVRQSHHFAGRFENIYADEADIPEINGVLDVLKLQTAKLLAVPADSLKAGFWFNAMQAGQRTTPHHHDENGELLSAVYYIRVPGNSGELILHAAGESISIHPQAGKLVMFAPAIMHEVTVHQGSGLRLSVGMNVGPVDGSTM